MIFGNNENEYQQNYGRKKYCGNDVPGFVFESAYCQVLIFIPEIKQI